MFKIILFLKGGERLRKKLEDVNNVYDSPAGKVSFMPGCLNRALLSELSE